MRDFIVPAPDVRSLIARERGRAIAAGIVIIGLAALAVVFIRGTVLTLDGAEQDVVAAQAAADTAKADANAARLATGEARAELDKTRAALADGAATLIRTRNELLQTTNALNAITNELQRVRARLATTEGERDQARMESANLRASLAKAGDDIASLQGELAGAHFRAFAGRGLVALANLRIDDLRANLALTDVRLSDAETLVAALDQHVGLAVAFENHLHPVAAEDLKTLSATSDRLGRLLTRILDLQKQKTLFSSANKPGVGFDSPGFTGYVLGRVVKGKTLASLPPTDTPNLGDIVRYRNGFTMFLLQDAGGRPFVIGMTPAGIAALEPDFGVPREGAFATGIFKQP